MLRNLRRGMELRVMPKQLNRVNCLRASPFQVYQIVFWLTFFIGGMYFPWQWGLAALVNLGILVWQMIRTGKLRLPGGAVEFVCGGIIFAGAVINLFVCVDEGGGREGLLRLFVCLLFLILLLQWTAEERLQLLNMIPLAGAVMVGVCAIGYCIPVIHPLVFTNERMAGCFQYANTFALFLLLGLMIDCNRRKIWWLIRILLLAGIVASGSRWTMLLLLGWFLWKMVHRELDKSYLRLLVLAGVLLLIIAVAFRGWTFARFWESDAFSTIWGRLLYLQDAISILADHPAGVGYLGWFYLQRTVQTGVYNVRFVHNEWVQIALDYGIPAAAGAVVLVIYRLRKGCLAPALAVMICLHSMVDPDLQFYGMLTLLMLTLSPTKECKIVLSASIGKDLAVSLAAVISVFAISRGVADLALQTGHLSLACNLAPYDTEAAVEQMLARDTLIEATADAHQLLSRNPYLSIAWQIVAENALDRGEYENMAIAQQEAVKTQKYDQTVYDDALSRLTYAVEAGWPVDQAAAEMGWLVDYMDKVLEGTSPLGWEIVALPELSFPVETRMQIRMLQQMAEFSEEE